MKLVKDHPLVRRALRQPLIARVFALVPWRFVKFGIVGTGGYLTDVFILNGLTGAGMGKYTGQTIAFVAATGFTWMVNRFWTFSDRRKQAQQHIAIEWVRYLAVTGIGFVINFAAFWATGKLGGVWDRHLFLPVAAGSGAGLLWNFPMSRFVFKPAGSGLQEGPASFSGP